MLQEERKEASPSVAAATQSEAKMASWNQIEAQWPALAGQVKAKWNRLTDEDLARIAGRSESLVSMVQERYGVLRVYAEKNVSDWAGALPLAKIPLVEGPRPLRRNGRHPR